MKKRHWKKLLVAGSAAVATAAVVKKTYDDRQKIQRKRDVDAEIGRRVYGEREAYIIGGGLAGLAAAAYLVRDCNFPGQNIHILESGPTVGAWNAGSGPQGISNYGCLLFECGHENFWELFSAIPSRIKPSRSVAEEIRNFAESHPVYAKARLMNREGKILDAADMGFRNEERKALGMLLFTAEEDMECKTIEEWFADMPHFFETGFWEIWQSAFGFRPESAMVDFKRSFERRLPEFGRLDTQEGMVCTPWNLHESILLPLKVYLEKRRVQIHTGVTVTDLDFTGQEIEVTRLYLHQNGKEQRVELKAQDLCFLTNGSVMDHAAAGDLDKPASGEEGLSEAGGLWKKIADRIPGYLGNPETFYSCKRDTARQYITVTCRGNNLLGEIGNITGNVPGSGGFISFRESGWKLSIMVPFQPYFQKQSLGETVFWGMGLMPEETGTYIQKPMQDCTGREIVMEILGHLGLMEIQDELMETVIQAVPCLLPYGGAPYQPRSREDRPPVVPERAANLALIGSFAEVKEELALSAEYEVRSARTAVYTLLKIDKEIAPVTPYKKDPMMLVKALHGVYR